MPVREKEKPRDEFFMSFSTVEMQRLAASGMAFH